MFEVGKPSLPKDAPEIRALADSYDLLSTWPSRPDYLDLLLAAGRVIVARAEGRVVGYGGAFEGQRQTHLTDLFVQRDVTGRGIGAAILAALQLDPARTTTFSSADPRAHALYRRLGLGALDKLSYLVGDSAAIDGLGELTNQTNAAHGAEGRLAIDRHLELRGDLHGGAIGTFLTRTARPFRWASGYAWLRIASDRACVGPVASDEGAALAVVTEALLEAIKLRPRVQVMVAHGHPVHARLLESGFVIESEDTFMAGKRSLVDLTRYCPDPDLG